MKSLVVRQPITDKEGKVVGNEVMFQHGQSDLYNSSLDAQAADTISNFFLQNNDKIYDGGLIFITFTPSLLFRNTPKIFESDKLIIQIEDTVLVNPLSKVIVQKYRKEGYCFAINDFRFTPRYFSMLDNADYIKINIAERHNETEQSSLGNIVRMAQGFKKKCIAYGVDTKADYEFAKGLNVDYLEGTYISDATIIKTKKMEFIQGNFFQLVVSVTQDEPDVAEIEEIISRDAYLTYALLKLVNSKYFAQRKKISSIRQALVILGIVQLKQWVYLLSFNSEEYGGGHSAAEQILKKSFLRGKFCSYLSKYVPEFPLTPNEAYMIGIFSTLDYMVDAPLAEVLEELPIRDEIKEALLEQKGVCGKLYSLVLSYEKADWQAIHELVKELEIPDNLIAQIYFDCIEEVNEIWRNISMPFEDEKTNLENAVVGERENALREELVGSMEPGSQP